MEGNVVAWNSIGVLLVCLTCSIVAGIGAEIDKHERSLAKPPEAIEQVQPEPISFHI